MKLADFDVKVKFLINDLKNLAREEMSNPNLLPNYHFDKDEQDLINKKLAHFLLLTEMSLIDNIHFSFWDDENDAGQNQINKQETGVKSTKQRGKQ